MSKSLENEPVNEPAPIHVASNIIAEGNREIGAQIRAAVDNILHKGASVSPADLRKWGPRGVGYFFKVLRQRIAEDMSAAPQPAAPQVRRESANHVRKTNDAPTIKNARRDPATSLVSTERDWATQQSNRWSMRMRVIVRGIIMVVMLFIGGAVLVRMWPAFYVEVQQQIQNWR
jgi:hypothetical protein